MNEDKVLQKLIDHDETLGQIQQKMATTADISEINNRLDKMVTILERLDKERVFTAEWIKRIESEVQKHSLEIKQLKQELNIT